MNPYLVHENVRKLLDTFNKGKQLVFYVYSSYDPYGVKLLEYIKNSQVYYYTGEIFVIDLFEVPNLISYLPVSKSPSLYFYNTKGELQIIDIPSAIYRWVDKQDNYFIDNL